MSKASSSSKADTAPLAPPYSANDPNAVLLSGGDLPPPPDHDDDLPPPFPGHPSPSPGPGPGPSSITTSSHAGPSSSSGLARTGSTADPPYRTAAEEKAALERTNRALEQTHLDATTGFASIGFIDRDILRLSKFPAGVLVPVGEVIVGFWSDGIVKHTECPGGWDWKLNGRPWGRHADGAIPARQLMLRVFDALSRCGWHIQCEINISHNAGARDTVVLRRGEVRERRWFAVAFHGWDKMRLVDCPNEQVDEVFQATLMKWPHGIQESKIVNGQRLVKFKGRPFMRILSGDDLMLGKLFMLDLLAAFDEAGYELVASICLSVGTDNDHKDHDTWFLASKV